MIQNRRQIAGLPPPSCRIHRQPADHPRSLPDQHSQITRRSELLSHPLRQMLDQSCPSRSDRNRLVSHTTGPTTAARRPPPEDDTRELRNRGAGCFKGSSSPHLREKNAISSARLSSLRGIELRATVCVAAQPRRAEDLWFTLPPRHLSPSGALMRWALPLKTLGPIARTYHGKRQDPGQVRNPHRWAEMRGEREPQILRPTGWGRRNSCALVNAS